ncbi:MAG: ubiquinone biosynthesis regulatory protein kinase UbiB, partial [Aquabacterium sp.]
ERWMHEQVGWRGLLHRLKREAPRYAKLLPELPRLVHRNLERSDSAIHRDLLAILAEQRRTNRILSAVVWMGLGFLMGLFVARLLLQLHESGAL